MITKNLEDIYEKIRRTADSCGRDYKEIKLVAVSKKFPAGKMNEAYNAGQSIFGENYIQEVIEKRPQIDNDAKIHFIGNLQSNKAKIAAELCDVVETVDRAKLGRILNKHCAALGKTLDILVQVNIGDDPNKSGVSKDSVIPLIVQLNELEFLRVKGLMTIPPLSNSIEKSRVYFQELRLLAEDLNTKGLFPQSKNIELSMGMSGDFHVAIEEGATIIRVGTAIFGQRDSQELV